MISKLPLSRIKFERLFHSPVGIQVCEHHHHHKSPPSHFPRRKSLSTTNSWAITVASRSPFGSPYVFCQVKKLKNYFTINIKLYVNFFLNVIIIWVQLFNSFQLFPYHIYYVIQIKSYLIKCYSIMNSITFVWEYKYLR